MIRPNTSEVLPFKEYDLVIVSFSGGKDSLACVLRMLDLGVPISKLEL
jgi:tRNA(Ile)-lysidine synthase TilS/MesJ